MKLKTLSAVLLTGTVLAACGGNGKLSPNEFEIVARAPLVVPPESTLRPPRPGQANAQSINPPQQAFEALFPGKRFPREVPKSAAENQLLSQLPRSEPDVRSNAGQSDLKVVKKALLLADLLDADERQFRPDNIEIERVDSQSGSGGN